MKTQDVKVDKHYLYKGEIRRVVKRIPGKETNKPNMQSGQMFTGNKRKQKTFLLDSGDIVKANQLSPLDFKGCDASELDIY